MNERNNIFFYSSSRGNVQIWIKKGNVRECGAWKNFIVKQENVCICIFVIFKKMMIENKSERQNTKNWYQRIGS